MTSTQELRACAEHEAAHAIVALHSRITVYGIHMRADGSGYTQHTGDCPTAVQAAITAAGDLWQRELGTVPYIDLSCSDLPAFAREHGIHRLWTAEQDARRILIQRRRAVLALADRLMAERSIRLAPIPTA